MNKNEVTTEVKLITECLPKSIASDRYRMLFSKVDLNCRLEGKKIIAVTSSIKGEGKTTTVSNLAVVAARDFGKRCLLLDGDFNNPALSLVFGKTKNPGLIDVLENRVRLGEIIRKSPIQNLAILPMGRPSPSTSKNHIWASEKIKKILSEVRGWFDYVWVDAPPILPMFDMTVISEAVDGILLVVQSGKTPTSVLSLAVKSLDSKKVIGSVLNRAKVSWPSTYYNYRY
ncbi:MAG: CpsD/CapB family tyrosine-protein kinase [Verrucomicrobiales bacterium]